ncbi:MAG: SH3 domain-containing protein [Prevotella sp.]|nr:SH3 domain-containing protein [Prevotella sp.]
MRKSHLFITLCLTIMLVTGCHPSRPGVTDSNTYVDSITEPEEDGASVGTADSTSVTTVADSDAVAAPETAASPRQAVKRVVAHSEDGYVNIRKQPTVASDTIGRLFVGGEGAEYLGTSGEWYQVLYHGKKGYVKSVYAAVDSTGNGAAGQP